MPSYDHEGDLQALVDVATGMAELLQAFTDKGVEDFAPSEGDLSNDTVWTLSRSSRTAGRRPRPASWSR
ncbi:MAG: hypothetical protein LH468_06545 [Nocardioides sp.]|nr:hypothetical protein [Nocardioides sp.]